MPIVTKSFANTVSFTRASNATYFDSAGVLRRAASNVSRIDYNPSTLAVRGLLIEEQRTNSLVNSEYFDKAAWTKSFVDILTNAATSPTGALSAHIMRETTATNQHLIGSTISSVTSGAVYTLSCFVKVGSGSRKVFLTAFGEGYSVFDPVNGSVVQTGNNICAAQNCGNGWWRFSAVITKTNTNAGFFIGLWSTTNNYTGDGTSSLQIWGAQVELGAFPTSYIPSSMTFSGRTSIGTYFASDGLIRTAPSGVARNQYNPTNLGAEPFLLLEDSITNLVTYSEDLNSWNINLSPIIYPNASTAPNGSLSADQITATASGTGVYRILTTTTATIHTMSVFLKNVSGASSISFGCDVNPISATVTVNLITGVISSSGANVTRSSITSVGNGWYRVSVTFTTTSTAPSIIIYNSSGSAATWLAWGAQVEIGAFPTSYIPSTVTFSGRTSSGNYFDYLGDLQSAGSGEARITYNPSNLTAEPFLLLEESRTNSIRNNTMVGAVAGTPGALPTNWSYFSATTGLTSSIVGTGIENGISYIDLRVVGTAGSAAVTEIGIDSGAATTGQTWTASLYWRISGGSATNITSFSLGQIELTSAGSFVTGAFVNQTAPTTAALNTQRISYTRTLSGGATVAQVSQRFNFIPVNGAAIDITLRIGMPQLEQGAFPTSVISTSSAAVTRAADTSTSSSATRAADTSTSATATRANDVANVKVNRWLNDTEGTLFVDSTTSITYAGTNQFPFNITVDNGISSNRFVIVTRVLSTYTDSSYGVSVGGVSQSAFDTNVNDGSQKKALAIKTNDFAFAVGGTVKYTDSSGDIPTVNRFSIGNQNDSSNFLNGWIRSIKYYPRRLTNAELQALTT